MSHITMLEEEIGRLRTELHRTRAQLAREVNLNDRLCRAATALTEGFDTGALVKRLTDKAMSLCDAELGAFFHRADPESDEYVLYSTSGPPAERVARAVPGGSAEIFRLTIAHGEVVRLADARADRRFGEQAGSPGEPPLASYLGVPVISRSGEIFGALVLGSPTPGVFESYHERIVVALAAHAAAALENSRLYHEVVRAEASRRESQAALAQSESRFRRLEESGIIGVVTWARDGRLTTANDAFLRMVGHSREDLEAGRLDWRSMSPAEYADDDERAIAELEATGVSRPFEKELLRRDGSRVPVLLGCMALENQSDRGVAYFVDLTMQRQAEMAARRQEVRFRALAENGLDGILLLSAEGEILYVSPAGARILALPPEDLVGQRLSAFLPAEEVDDARRAIDRTLTAPAQPVTCDLGWGRNAATLRHLEVRFVNRLADPAMASLVVHFRDVTDRRLLEAQFAESQKLEAVGRLAGGIAHDFNNVLSAILGISEIAVDDLPPESPLRDDLVQITRAARRAATLTGQLLAFSRRQVLEPRAVDCGAQIAEMAPMLARLIGEDIQITCVRDEEVARALVDPGQLEQVIMNLVVNARDAMPHGGAITVSVQNALVAGADGVVPPGRYVCVSVADKGLGIDPSVRDRIFEPFFTTKPRGKGTGLGLPMVFGIVKQSGGHILVESEVGIGTIFRIYLPQTSAPRFDGRRTTERPAFVAPGEGELVLLVEDEEAVRDVARRALQRHGFEVVTARNGAEALLVAATHGNAIDLLVTDVVMPQMGGPELVQRLRSGRPDLKVVFMSGYLDQGEQALRAAGAAHYLQKPITPGSLVSKVRQALVDDEHVA